MNERFFISSEIAPDNGAIEELSRVSLLKDIEIEGIGRIPAGSRGTIVAVYDRGSAYCVEFTKPFQTEVDLARGDLEVVAGESRADIIDAAKHASR